MGGGSEAPSSGQTKYRAHASTPLAKYYHEIRGERGNAIPIGNLALVEHIELYRHASLYLVTIYCDKINSYIERKSPDPGNWSGSSVTVLIIHSN